MRVHELIEILKGMPQDAVVVDSYTNTLDPKLSNYKAYEVTTSEPEKGLDGIWFNDSFLKMKTLIKSEKVQIVYL